MQSSIKHTLALNIATLMYILHGYIHAILRLYCVHKIAVFQSNERWDHTAKVHPELEALYTEYQSTRGKAIT